MTVAHVTLEEFEAACRDPRVIELNRRAAEYAEELIRRGHCPMCLTVNCSHQRKAPDATDSKQD